MQLHAMYTIIVVWATLTQSSSKDSHVCPKHCTCKKSKVTMTCNGSRGVLTYIPTPPGYVKRIHLIDVNLGQITRQKMKNVTFCKLTYLELNGTNVSTISPDAFVDLQFLQVLKWNQSYFPMEQFNLALKQVHSPLGNILIQAKRIDSKTVSASRFQRLTNLQNLSLSLTEMKTFNASGLGHLKNLTKLDLSNNMLVEFHLQEVLANLEKLDLSQNDFVRIPLLCSRTFTPLVPKLNHLTLEDNAIRVLNTSVISCLENLYKLSLTQNRIEHLHDNVFANLPALTELHLSYTSNLHKIDDLAFNSTSLSKLVMVRNAKLSLHNFNPKVIFTHLPNLTCLDMSNTKLNMKTDDLRDLLLPLKSLEHLRLQASIMSLPTGLFSHLTNLTRLILAGNSLSGWDESVFVNVTSVKEIFLDGNKLKTINESSFPLEFRLSVKVINLAHNPFDCTCDLMWFRNWLRDARRNNSITFDQYPNSYMCRSPTRMHLKDYNPTLKSCTVSQIYFVILIFILTMCIVFTVAGLVTYRYRWYILYWISLMRRRRQRQESPAQIRYDGFVSYSNPDWDWVSSELLQFLEIEEGLRICEHSRDFKAGMYIVDNVIEAMDTSRKTILVISNEYMKSDWCQFELRMALSSFLQNEIDIVVILLEHINSSHVSASLRALLVTVNYVEWSDDEEARRLFRDRIRSALRE